MRNTTNLLSLGGAQLLRGELVRELEECMDDVSPLGSRNAVDDWLRTGGNSSSVGVRYSGNFL
jgi:hypothetical protein